jgi:NADH dehydrogenase [ubiquinone] 1 alpha subcomplex assembly factor 1
MNGKQLQWFRLDDGVMGGQSETQHYVAADAGIMHFAGTINTNGGGFTSIRTKLPEQVLSKAGGVKLRVRGDGKTYKFFMTDGSRVGPLARKPSWHVDLPTVKSSENDDGNWQEVVLPFSKLLPLFVSGSNSQVTDEDRKRYKFDASEMKEMGIMLSLRLSDGRPNPVATFGEGIFPFSLLIQSIEPVPLSSLSNTS